MSPLAASPCAAASCRPVVCRISSERSFASGRSDASVATIRLLPVSSSDPLLVSTDFGQGTRSTSAFAAAPTADETIMTRTATVDAIVFFKAIPSLLLVLLTVFICSGKARRANPLCSSGSAVPVCGACRQRKCGSSVRSSPVIEVAAFGVHAEGDQLCVAQEERRPFSATVQLGDSPSRATEGTIVGPGFPGRVTPISPG